MAPRSKKVSTETSKADSAFPVPLAPSAIVPSKTEALQLYLQSIKDYPLLSPEKEREIAEGYLVDHDPQKAKILILANLRLVVKIAYEYSRTGIHLLDLIQEGNVGLLQAVKEFDPEKGAKLSSYASYWIKAYIRAFVLKNFSLVKVGTTKAQRSLFYRLQKEKNRLEAQGLSPEPKLLADRLQVKEREVVEMSQRLSGRDVSLNSPLQSDSSEGNSLLQILRDPSQDIDDALADREIRGEFIERLNTFERSLAGKELLIFRERLRAESPKTLQEIGETYSITRERVRQIEARVLEKLRDYMKANARFMAAPYRSKHKGLTSPGE